LIKNSFDYGVVFLAMLALLSCQNPTEPRLTSEDADTEYFRTKVPPLAPSGTYIVVPYDVPIRFYFEYLDTLVRHLDTILHYPLSEHLLVRANPWIIDTLANTDYYHLMSRGIFEEDPESLLALQQGDSLYIPDSLQAMALYDRMASTRIEVNIPEFALRIYEGECLIHTFPVRVGQNKSRFLAMAGRNVDLRTRTGEGTIVRINKNPCFINPKDNKVYESTRRDDGRRTKLPRIPWIEPSLNGTRYGQLIHPTTNPATLGKAYSNGCVGMGEADMWRVYYHAPIGTKVSFRYNLTVVDEGGDTLQLKNIYPAYPLEVKQADHATQTNAICECS
jgi:L,D-transpeptidase ErfK/SrfK